MKLLLTNDDGIEAPGLAALESAVRQFGTAVTVAPDQHLSGCSHQVNNNRELKVTEVAPARFSLDGTPADCTRIGLHHLAENADWVLSGVNEGGNLGVDVFMSGTVAAVREAAWHQVPGIAFSQYRKGRKEFDWSAVVPLVKRVLLALWDQPLEPGSFWNVNFPDLQADDSPAVSADDVELVFCPLNPHPLQTKFEVTNQRYIYRGIYGERNRDPGTDVDVCFSGKVAITKIVPNYGSFEG